MLQASSVLVSSLIFLLVRTSPLRRHRLLLPEFRGWTTSSIMHRTGSAACGFTFGDVRRALPPTSEGPFSLPPSILLDIGYLFPFSCLLTTGS
jgi:hypothetical protein